MDPSRGSLMVVGLTLMNQWLVGKAEREVCLPSCGCGAVVVDSERRGRETTGKISSLWYRSCFNPRSPKFVSGLN